MFSQFIDSPLGLVRISATSDGISEVLFTDRSGDNTPSPLTELAAQQLQAYFAGSLQHFSLPLAASGTAFSAGVAASRIRWNIGGARGHADSRRQRKLASIELNS